jgi:serine/threonine-protein kinase RsbT
MKYNIRAGDVDRGGSASARIKFELIEVGVDATTARRAGIVAFEGEINVIVYSDEGGTLSVVVEPDAVIIELEDTGPGIEDIDLAMTPGYSTAPAWATDLGFGAGMGLVNMEQHSDKFEIHSQIGVGTKIKCRIERKGDWERRRREEP